MSDILADENVHIDIVGELRKIRGEVYADFLPVTSDRSGFVTDSEEYQAFMAVMARVMEMVKGVLNRISYFQT